MSAMNSQMKMGSTIGDGASRNIPSTADGTTKADCTTGLNVHSQMGWMPGSELGAISDFVATPIMKTAAGRNRIEMGAFNTAYETISGISAKPGHFHQPKNSNNTTFLGGSPSEIQAPSTVHLGQ